MQIMHFLFEIGNPQPLYQSDTYDLYKVIMCPKTTSNKVLHLMDRTRWPHESANKK
jgi:hypothetical protein